MADPCDGEMVLYSSDNTTCTNPINPPRHLVHDEDPGGVPDVGPADVEPVGQLQEVPPEVVAEEGLEDGGGAGRISDLHLPRPRPANRICECC